MAKIIIFATWNNVNSLHSRQRVSQLLSCISRKFRVCEPVTPSMTPTTRERVIVTYLRPPQSTVPTPNIVIC